MLLRAIAIGPRHASLVPGRRHHERTLQGRRSRAGSLAISALQTNRRSYEEVAGARLRPEQQNHRPAWSFRSAARTHTATRGEGSPSGPPDGLLHLARWRGWAPWRRRRVSGAVAPLRDQPRETNVSRRGRRSVPDPTYRSTTRAARLTSGSRSIVRSLSRGMLLGQAALAQLVARTSASSSRP